ncbi:ArsR/SmtB family transcription factor [Nonomuraea sp. NPDC048826]|uniref:ArsR/SmtB family transcription factor n=1 Tax=Nonomuraea sp. NPDC048826 TaxID=3364347 RepID=UPI003722F53D
MIADLVRAESYLPDFLLQPECDSFAKSLERVHEIATDRLAADLSPAASRHASPWFRDLASGSEAAHRTLTSHLRTYFATSLAPMWPLVRATVAADRSIRAETLLRGGVDALSSTLGGMACWDPPVLRIPSSGAYDVRLCGRGLLLIPSYFAQAPWLADRPDDSSVLVYPICHGDKASGSADALGPLLGRTRAAVLAALRDPATTTTLAERVGISPASASQHASVLRNAGLISTTRIGGAVLHTLTPLGESLLRGDPTAR